MTTLPEIKQHYEVVTQELALDPGASVPAGIYLKHIEAMEKIAYTAVTAHNEAVTKNILQSGQLRAYAGIQEA